MDVTKVSFDAAYGHLQKVLPDCAFVSIDLEFTGLGWERPSHMDTPTQRYLVAKETSETFPPIQCGLSVFRRTTQKGTPNGDGDSMKKTDAKEALADVEWEAVPFNFQLFPRAIFRTPNAKYPMRERMMTFQSSSVDFLMKHGFNFQHCFQNGISWLRVEDEASARAELLASYSSPSSKTGKPQKAYAEPAERVAMEKLRQAVTKWIKTVGGKPGKKTMIVLQPYHLGKRLLYNVFERNFPNLFMRVNLNSRAVGLPPHLQVEIMDSAETARAKMNELQNQDFIAMVEKRMRDAVGFRRVIDLLVKSQKPLVVHHGMLDISKLLANFIAPLPDTLSGFKRVVQSAFPVVWDTRVMFANAARTRPWLTSLLNSEQGRSISGLIDGMRHPDRKGEVPQVWLELYNAHTDPHAPRVQGEKAYFDQYLGDNLEQYAHEAGFDALETGRAFLYLLGMFSGKQVGFDDVRRAKEEHTFLKTLNNRIYLGCCGGYFDLDLTCQADDGVSEEEEMAVENRRNEWINRDDVLVVYGMADDKANELVVPRDIPYSDYYKLAERVIKAVDTTYHHKCSIVMPLENGSFMFIPQLKKQKNGAPSTTASVAKPGGKVNPDVEMTTTVAADNNSVANGNGSTSGSESLVRKDSDSEMNDSNLRPPEPVTAGTGQEQQDVEKSKREIDLIRREIEKEGLTVVLYREALKRPRPKRMRVQI